MQAKGEQLQQRIKKSTGRYPPSVVNECTGCHKQMSAKEAKRHRC